MSSRTARVRQKNLVSNKHNPPKKLSLLKKKRKKEKKKKERKRKGGGEKGERQIKRPSQKAFGGVPGVVET